MITAEKGIDVLEDMIDTFWENPLAFAVMVHNKYREPMLDVFSGRIYEHSLHHRVVTRRWWRSASCSSGSGATTIETLFSIPIGSRFHPERAELWNSELSSVEGTEAWIRDNT